jgi:hypothetical protein
MKSGTSSLIFEIKHEIEKDVQLQVMRLFCTLYGKSA